MRTVGILGGMGPEATVLLMQRVVAAVPARDDADHIPLIVHQNPAVPSRIRHLIDRTGSDPAPVLAAMARDLAAAGAAALAMPCNTAHAYAPAIRAATALPFLDMVAATAAALPQGARVGMLASPATRIAGVFDAPLAARGIVPVWPGDEGPALALIRRVKTGDAGADACAELARQADALVGCDHLLVACTEMSLLTQGLGARPFTDSLDCLVDQIVAFARG
ncbi:MAG: aspartate/glutamate racemase family protein [Gemmobacter sp.]